MLMIQRCFGNSSTTKLGVARKPCLFQQSIKMDTKEKLNIFNKCFLKSSPLPVVPSPTLEETECGKSLEQVQLTSEDVQVIIQNMERNEPTGADGLPPIFLKICVNEISPILGELYNQMLRKGMFPKIMKEAYLFPLYKWKGSRNSVKSYRPISILSCSAEILEKAIYQAINKFLDDPERSMTLNMDLETKDRLSVP